MFKLAIFDFDGTLVSSLSGIHAAISRTLQRRGFGGPSESEVRATVGLSLEESIETLTKGRCSPEDIGVLAAEYRSLHASYISPLTELFDGVIETLAVVKSLGIRTVIVSNKGRLGLQELLDRFSLTGFVDLALSASDVNFRKPDPRLFTEHIHPLFPYFGGEILVVGDTVTDLEFARNIGALSCWARYGYGDEQACLKLEPDFCINALADLGRVFASARTRRGSSSRYSTARLP